LSIYEPQDSLFQENIVFGTVPLGNPADTSFNLLRHLNAADIIVVETVSQFSRLISGLRDYFNRVQTGVQIEPHATIYVYNLRDQRDHIEHMNAFLLDEAFNKNKKILVVSDEGCSNFLDPGSFLKYYCIEKNIAYKTLPGPNSIIAAITSAHSPVGNFAFSIDTELLDEKEKEKYFSGLKNLSCPIIFTTNPETLKDSLVDFHKYFGNEYYAELFINLTRKNEKVIRGSSLEVLDYVQQNPSEFNYFNENENNRYAFLISPPVEKIYDPQREMQPYEY
jgi:16S rRNA (cytidine1402-2'-O)-methyltransferase